MDGAMRDFLGSIAQVFLVILVGLIVLGTIPVPIVAGAVALGGKVAFNAIEKWKQEG